jgi:hypothetical protein
VLRIWGITQWTTEDHEIGIRFIHPTFGSKNQLAGLLTFLVDHSAEDVVKSAMAEVVTAPATTPILVLEKRDNVPQKPKSPDLPRLDTKSEGRSTALSSAAAPARETPAKIKSGKEYEWPAVIRFTKDGLHVAGVIVDLNLGGCSVRTAEPYISGIYHHVEVDFHMRGLPFRIAGATEAVRDKHTVDIRFLQLSSRKRQELAQLIFELCEPDKAK